MKNSCSIFIRINIFFFVVVVVELAVLVVLLLEVVILELIVVAVITSVHEPCIVHTLLSSFLYSAQLNILKASSIIHLAAQREKLPTSI